MKKSNNSSILTISIFVTLLLLIVLFAHHILSTIWVIGLYIYKIIFLLPFYMVQCFYNSFLYVTACIFAGLIVFLRNPIYSLLSLIIVFFHVLIFLLALKIEFLSLIFLIVYVGAIAILFLFVIMMFNLKQLSITLDKSSTWNKKTIIIFMGIAYPLAKLFFLIEKYITIFVINNIVDTKLTVINTVNLQEIITHKIRDILLFSDIFYTYYAFIFILSSFILFAAMIGAIILALQANKASSAHIT